MPITHDTGGKAAGLDRLGRWATDLGVAVPPWTVLPATAFDRVVAPAVADVAGGERQATVAALELPKDVVAEVSGLLERAKLSGRKLAVRSSALGEDGQAASFAGQFETVLGVDGGDLAAVLDAVRRVWASAFTAHAVAYTDGKLTASVRMAVVMQALAEPVASGVAFSVDPITGDDAVAVVSAVYGLGEGLVSGELDADTYRVERNGAVQSTLAVKTGAVRLGADGRTTLTEIPSDRQKLSSLTDAEARRIADVSRRLADRLGGPQDIEWAVGDEPGRPLYLLQTRPVTTRSGERRIWDNSNIVESYGGVTTPLTFSFARGVYADVYRQFCAVMGVDAGRLAAHEPVFAAMLGLVRGRIYYNLLAWYRSLALLPGFALNRGFMERMMGVGQALPTEVIERLSGEAVGGRWTDLGRVARMIGKLTVESRRLKTEVPAFHAKVAAALGPLREADLTAWTPDRLRDLYRLLERDLLRAWAPPLVNDFFAMVWFGILSKLVARWLPDEPATLMNDLLIGTGDIVSTEPARRVAALADRVRHSPALTARFDGESDDTRLLDLLRVDPAATDFLADFDGYLDRFGDRTTGELKLETITFRERPGDLLTAVRRTRSAPPLDPGRLEQSGAAARLAAEAVVRKRLSWPKRLLFGRVLRQTRDRVRDRENLRLERTRVFGVVRRIAVGFGANLVRRGLLDEPRDVFYLTFPELFGWLDGTGVAVDFRALVAARRTEYDGYAATEPPPDRFETVGPPEAEPSSWRIPTKAVSAAGEGGLSGLGCCPGVVRAPVRLVRDPNRPGELNGHILVAERTDPGWTLLFPAALGLIVERGSLLSHSAIVARELGLPCIVSVGGLMSTLVDGELVEMDGATGTIHRLNS